MPTCRLCRLRRRCWPPLGMRLSTSCRRAGLCRCLCRPHSCQVRLRTGWCMPGACPRIVSLRSAGPGQVPYAQEAARDAAQDLHETWAWAEPVLRSCGGRTAPAPAVAAWQPVHCMRLRARRGPCQPAGGIGRACTAAPVVYPLVLPDRGSSACESQRLQHRRAGVQGRLALGVGHGRLSRNEPVGPLCRSAPEQLAPADVLPSM